MIARDPSPAGNRERPTTAGYGRPDGRRGVVIIGRCTRADVAQLCELTSCDYVCRSMRARMGSVGGEIGSGCQSRWVDSGRLLVVLAGPGLVCGLEMGEEHQPPLLVRLDVFVGEEAVVDRDEGSAVGWGEGELGSEYEIAIERRGQSHTSTGRLRNTSSLITRSHDPSHGPNRGCPPQPVD